MKKESSVKAAFPIGHYTNMKSPERVKEEIGLQLKQWFGKIPSWRLESIAISASWQVWVRVRVFSQKLNNELQETTA